MAENQAIPEVQSASPEDSIKEGFDALSYLSNDCCIYMVPGRLRRLNPDAYTPRIVSIGPLHHGGEEYEAMEDHKLRYLKSFIPKTALSLEGLVEIARTWEDSARLCYAEDVPLDSNAFVKMLVVDAGFLVVLLLRSQFDEDENELDRIYGKPKLIVDVNHDIMLLENQLPYFVVKAMFELLKSDVNRGGTPLPVIIHGHFKKYWMSIPIFSQTILEHETHHFVDILRSIHLPPDMRKFDSTRSAKKIQNKDETDKSGKSMKMIDSTLSAKKILREAKIDSSGESMKMIDSTLSAKKIQNAGVKLKPADSSTAPLDIKFANGVLTIPKIHISDITEALYRNIMVFEQCQLLMAYFSDYMIFLSCFVRSSSNAELFIDNGIIVNRRGNAKHIASLFDGILKETTQTSYSTFCYQSIYERLEARCNKPLHKSLATLRHDYFSNSWSGISVGAAGFLLILTFIQTVCSILGL